MDTLGYLCQSQTSTQSDNYPIKAVCFLLQKNGFDWVWVVVFLLPHRQTNPLLATSKSWIWSPNPGSGRPNPELGRPNLGFGRPNLGFGCPNPGFGRPNPGFGCPNPGFGRPSPGFG